MTYDPNDRNDPRNSPGVNNNMQVRRSASWVPWLAVIAVILVGAFVWSQMGGSTTDPQTTSSTTAPATDQQGATAPASPAVPPADNAAPASPPAGGATGGTSQP